MRLGIRGRFNRVETASKEVKGLIWFDIVLNYLSIHDPRPTTNEPTTPPMRLDKWLWSARFFKTRSLAQAAVAGGKVKLNGERAKAAKEIAPGARLTIRIGELEWAVTVKALSDQRRSADVARELYEEEEASRTRRTAQVADRRAQASVWGERKGRPTKRDRREMERWARREE